MTPTALTALAAAVYHRSEQRLAIAALALQETVRHLEAASLELANLPIPVRLDAWRCVYLDAVDRSVRLSHMAHEHEQVWGGRHPAADAVGVRCWSTIREERAAIAHLEQMIEARTPGRLSLVSSSGGVTDQREGGASTRPPHPPFLTVIPSLSSASAPIPLGSPQPDRRSVTPPPIRGTAGRHEAPRIEDTGPSGQGSVGADAPVSLSSPSLPSPSHICFVLPVTQ